MTELDDKIRQALNETGIDTSELGSEQDDSLKMMISDAYQGRLRWMFVLATFWQLLFTAIFFWSGYRLFTMVGSDEPIFWATIFLMSGVGVSMLKLMQWMLINRNRILREVKRLELEVARFGKKLSSRDSSA